MKKFSLSLLLNLGGFAVFVLGNPFYTIFPTNWNLSYYLLLAGFFLLLSLVFKRSVSLSLFWPATYALFIASSALVFLKIGLLNIPRDESNPLQFLVLDKLSQFLQIVPVIIGLTLAAKEDLGSIFIKRGNLKRGLTFGLVSFGGYAALALIIQWNSRDFISVLPAALPWVLLFIFANAIMEELWFRAIFLRKYEKLVGRTAAILITSLVFGASHVNATYEFPGGGFVFGLVVFGLGLVGAYAMLKDDSLIGPVLFHAGYDLTIIGSILASL